MVTKVSDTVAGGPWEELLRYDPNASSGLIAAFKGGYYSTNNTTNGTILLSDPVTIVLPDDLGSDIYYNYSDGTLGLDGLVDNIVLIYSIVTASGAISSVTDKRSLARRRFGAAGPKYSSYNTAIDSLVPDHWWKFNEDLEGLGAGLHVTDVGNAGTLYDGGVDSIAPTYTWGNADVDEWSYKIEKSQEIDWGIKSSGVIPADLAAATTGTFSYQFRVDQDDADAPITEGDGVLCIMERIADATWDNTWAVYLTQRGDRGDMPYNPHRELVYRVNIGGTANFYELTYDIKDLFDGVYHSVVIVQDGVAVQVYLDGVNITSAMTETTGGSGVDATDWWASVTPTVMIVGNSSNTPVANLTHFGSHLAFWLTELTATDALDIWESIEPLEITQGTNDSFHFDLTDEWNKKMLASKPTWWVPMNDSAGPLVREIIGGASSTGFVSNSANVTFGGAGPGGLGLGHIQIANTSGDESAGIRMNTGYHGPEFSVKRYFAIGGWFYVDETSISDEVGLLSWLPRTVANDGCRIWLTSGRLLRFLLWDSSTATRRTTIESTAALSLQAWHYVMWYYDNSATGWRMWIDGTEDTTFTVDPDSTLSTDIAYGHDQQHLSSSGILCLGYQLDQGSTAVATFGARQSQQSTIRMSNWAGWNNVHTQANSDDHQNLGINRTNKGTGSNLISDLWDLGRGV